MPKPKPIIYEMLGFQKQFHESTKPKVYLSTGLGGGKTYSLIMKCFKLMNINRGTPGGMLVPTYKMYKRDVVPTMRDICRENNIRHKYNKTDFVWTFPDVGAQMWIFHSDDDGASIKGPNLSWGAINEVTLCSEASMKMLLGRMRIKKAKLIQLVMSGTPEGFDWCYEYFVEKPREDTELIFGNSRDNFHVADSYVRMLEESYDPLMQKQYIDGQFINLNKKSCAYAFDRTKHVSGDVERLDDYPIWVSIDFNVTPMSAVLWNRVPFGELSRQGWRSFNYDLRAFDEINLQSSNTYELADAIKAKLGPISDPSQVVIYPDPTGIARSTQSRGTSDIGILKSLGFTNVRYKSRISVRDCLNALNAKLSKDRIIISSRCTNLIADLEQCTFKQGTFEIDKVNLKRSHWLDGMKNMIDYEFPIGGRRTHREVKYI